VLPSTETAEAFGMVQLEAMAHGVPVINTSLASGVPSVSIHGETGLTVSPGNVKDLREAIRTLESDEQLRNRFPKNAQERVRLFSHSAVIGQIRSLYADILQSQA